MSVADRVSHSTGASAAFVYIFSAIIILLTLFGGVQTIRFYSRGDISGRFPLLLLFNGLCILGFAIFSILAIASDISEHVINVLILSTTSLAFTVQLLRAIRLLFTIEVRNFISKQFADQFAYGEGYEIEDIDQQLLDDDHSDESSISNNQNQDYQDEDDEADSEADDEYSQASSAKYSASYEDYERADAEFGNASDSSESSSSEDEDEQLVNAVVPGDQVPETVNPTTENSALFSSNSSLSQDVGEDDEDLSTALGRWIFEHKSLASSSFMTGLALFIFCKYVLLLVLFSTTCGLNWSWILWLVVLTFSVLSSALTVGSLKMVRIRAYIIWEKTKQDHEAKYSKPKEPSAKVESAKRTSLQNAIADKSTSRGGSVGAKVSTERSNKAKAARRARSGSDSRSVNGSGRNGSAVHHTKAAAQVKRPSDEKAHAAANASDETGAVSIFGTKIVDTGVAPPPPGARTKDPQWANKKKTSKVSSTNSQSSSTANVTKSSAITTNEVSNTGHQEQSTNKSREHSTHSLVVQEEHEVQADIPQLQPAPPTTIFTSSHDPSGQMMELLVSALGSGLFYGLALLLAIIYSAQHEIPTGYNYFIITPTQYSPTFTRGILILLSLSNITIVYTSLVHIIISEQIRNVMKIIFGDKSAGGSVGGDQKAHTLSEVLADPASRDEFRKFLDGEFSAENLLFWNAIEEYRARPVAHFQSRSDTISSAKYIFSTYLAPGGVYEVNISSQCREKISTRLKTLLEEDPIARVKELEEREIMAAYDNFVKTNGGPLYHLIEAHDPPLTGMKSFDYLSPEEEASKPKSKRALATAVASLYGEQINSDRTIGDIAKERPYPINVFEQYTFVQIGDIYSTISRIIQREQQQNPPLPRGDEKSFTRPDQGPAGGRQNIMVVEHPYGPPSRLPSIAQQRGAATAAATHANTSNQAIELDNMITMLHAQKNGMNVNPILAKQQAMVEELPEQSSTEEGEMVYVDHNIAVNELSRTRNDQPEDSTMADANAEQSEEDNGAFPDKIQPNWTIYDVIRYKFQQYEQYQGKKSNVLMYDHGNGEHKPYPPPAAGDGRRRRRRNNNNGAGAAGAQPQQQTPEEQWQLPAGVRLHYALMSYQWKLNAARRRLKQYTDVVDELIVVFDAAQLEIFKLMERDSFARFCKSPEYINFLQKKAQEQAAPIEP